MKGTNLEGERAREEENVSEMNRDLKEKRNLSDRGRRERMLKGEANQEVEKKLVREREREREKGTKKTNGKGRKSWEAGR